MHDYASDATASRTFPAAYACLPDDESDQAFVGMLNSYRNSGGLARAKEVFNLFRTRSGLGVWAAETCLGGESWHEACGAKA